MNNLREDFTNTTSSQVADAPAQFVSFRLDRRLYALALDQVDTVLRMVAVTPVPEAPPWAMGVINLHGQVLPVVDLRQQFGQPAIEPRLSDRLLVVRTQGGTVAFKVDEVSCGRDMNVFQILRKPVVGIPRLYPLAIG